MTSITLNFTGMDTSMMYTLNLSASVDGLSYIWELSSPDIVMNPKTYYGRSVSVSMNFNKPNATLVIDVKVGKVQVDTECSVQVTLMDSDKNMINVSPAVYPFLFKAHCDPWFEYKNITCSDCLGTETKPFQMKLAIHNPLATNAVLRMDMETNGANITGDISWTITNQQTGKSYHATGLSPSFTVKTTSKSPNICVISAELTDGGNTPDFTFNVYPTVLYNNIPIEKRDGF